MNEISLQAPLGYPACASPKHNDEVILVSPPNFDCCSNDDVFVIPGETNQDHEEFVRSVGRSFARASFNSSNTLLGRRILGSNFVERNLFGARELYLQGLDNMRVKYPKPSAEAALKVSMLRNQLRDFVRSKTQIPVGVYSMLDKLPSRVRSKERLQENLKIIKDGRSDKATLNKAISKVYNGAFSSNSQYNVEWVKTSREYIQKLKLNKAAKHGNLIAIGYDIASVAYDFYTADTDEKLNQAYKGLAETGGGILGSQVSATVGASLCIVLGVSTGGITLAACGIVAGLMGGVMGGAGARAIADQIMESDKKTSDYYKSKK